MLVRLGAVRWNVSGVVWSVEALVAGGVSSRNGTEGFEFLAHTDTLMHHV